MGILESLSEHIGSLTYYLYIFHHGMYIQGRFSDSLPNRRNKPHLQSSPHEFVTGRISFELFGGIGINA